MAVPGVLDVVVGRSSIAVELPVGRHGDRRPGGAVIVLGVEIHRRLCGTGSVGEQPVSVQTLYRVRLSLQQPLMVRVVRQSVFPEEIGTKSFFVGKDVHFIPLSSKRPCCLRLKAVRQQGRFLLFRFEAYRTSERTTATNTATTSPTTMI